MSGTKLIHQAYRFGIAPTPEQERFLTSCCGASRFWFNQGLELVKQRPDRRMNGENVHVPWSYKSLCSEFAPLKNEVCPWRAEVVVGCMQAGLEQLGQALQEFSKGRRTGRRVGFPRFRAKGRCHESVIFQRPRLADSRHIVLDQRLGPLRTKEPIRKLIQLLERDAHARVIRSTVQRANGGWVISFHVERSPKRRRARRPGAAVGVDLGLARLATLSTGQTVANSRPLGGALIKLRRYTRQLDRQRRASNPANYLSDGRPKSGRQSWARSRRMARTHGRTARLHRRVANLRREQAHQLTTMLTREFGVIGVETVAIRNLMANPRVSRHISDVGWGTILTQLAYKTQWSRGSLLAAADRFNPSSKTCSACGAVRVKLSLSERVFTCDNSACAHVQDRDLNAALNLARMATRKAQTEGMQCYVATTGVETRNARGGQVRLDRVERSPMKREESGDSPQRGDVLALAATRH